MTGSASQIIEQLSRPIGSSSSSASSSSSTSSSSSRRHRGSPASSGATSKSNAPASVRPAKIVNGMATTTNTSQHVVHVHVNPGEVFSVRVNDQIQHIEGLYHCCHSLLCATSVLLSTYLTLVYLSFMALFNYFFNILQNHCL